MISLLLFIKWSVYYNILTVYPKNVFVLEGTITLSLSNTFQALAATDIPSEHLNPLILSPLDDWWNIWAASSHLIPPVPEDRWVAETEPYAQIAINGRIYEVSLLRFGTTVRLLNLLKTKRRLLYLKTQFVPRSKHFSSQL